MSNAKVKTPKKKKQQPPSTSAYNPIVITSFTEQLNSLITICNELKANQEKIMKTQLEMQTKLDAIEETKSSSHQNLQSEMKKYYNTITTKFDKCQESTEKVQTELFSYSDAVKKNFNETNETKKAISSINLHVENLKHNIENQIDSEKELKFINQKKNNVCVFNLPESSETNPEEAYKDDVKRLKQVLENKISLQKEDIKAIFRKGDQSNMTKPRRIIMRLSCYETKLKILKLRNLTSTIENNETVNIYIAPDRTIKQQIAHKKLVAELKERKNQGENVNIKNGEILKAWPFRRDPHSYWG